MNWNERLREYRKFKELEVRQFGTMMDLAVNNIYGYENGTVKPKSNFFEKLFEEFPALNANWLFRGVGSMEIDEAGVPVVYDTDTAQLSIRVQQLENQFKDFKTEFDNLIKK